MKQISEVNVVERQGDARCFLLGIIHRYVSDELECVRSVFALDELSAAAGLSLSPQTKAKEYESLARDMASWANKALSQTPENGPQ